MFSIHRKFCGEFLGYNNDGNCYTGCFLLILIFLHSHFLFALQRALPSVGGSLCFLNKASQQANSLTDKVLACHHDDKSESE